MLFLACYFEHRTPDSASLGLTSHRGWGRYERVPRRHITADRSSPKEIVVLSIIHHRGLTYVGKWDQLTSI